MTRLKLFILSAILVLAGSIAAQEIRVEAPQTAYANSPFQVRVMVSGGDFSDFKDPNFSGLKVLGRGSMTQIVNFKKSQGYTYTVMAESEGTATIGAASCTIGGSRYSTQPRQVKIEPARQQQQQRRSSPFGSMFGDDDEDPFQAMQQQMQQMMQQMDPFAGAPATQQPTYDPAGKNDADAIFAKISINKPNPYKGEQVLLTYKIYTRIDFNLTSGFHAPEKKGFWAENLLLDQKYIKPQQEVINGKRYISYELGREALYAQEDGNLKIDVMDLPIQAVFYTSQPINIGFFTIQASRPDPQQITLKTNPLGVKVKPLPSGAPPSFDGAVGSFSINGGNGNENQEDPGDEIETQAYLPQEYANGNMVASWFENLVIKKDKGEYKSVSLYLFADNTFVVAKHKFNYLNGTEEKVIEAHGTYQLDESFVLTADTGQTMVCSFNEKGQLMIGEDAFTIQDIDDLPNPSK